MIRLNIKRIKGINHIIKDSEGNLHAFGRKSDAEKLKKELIKKEVLKLLISGLWIPSFSVFLDITKNNIIIKRKMKIKDVLKIRYSKSEKAEIEKLCNFYLKDFYAKTPFFEYLIKEMSFEEKFLTFATQFLNQKNGSFKISEFEKRVAFANGFDYAKNGRCDFYAKL